MGRLYTYYSIGKTFDDSNNMYYLMSITQWDSRSDDAKQVCSKYYYIQGNRSDIDAYLTDDNCRYLLDTYKDNTKIKLSRVFSVTEL